MKPSYFNLFIDDSILEDNIFVYNTRTQAQAVLEKKIASLLRENKGKSIDLDIVEYNDLLEEGFCVEDNADEKEILRKWFHEISFDRRVITATILTTYKCNFSCPYCFEKNSDVPQMDMTKKTAAHICYWIFHKALEKKCTGVDIFFYGGEPLVNKDMITYIAYIIKRWCSYYNMVFRFGIITNGYLINRNDTENWKTIGLDFYRVTLDGSEQWHDRLRPLKGGGPTFQRIIENISNNSDGVKVMISGNFTEKTYPGVLQLIDYLGKSEIKDKIHSLSFNHVLDMAAKSCSAKTSSCCADDEEKEMRILQEIDRCLKKYHFKNSRPKTGMISCPFRTKDTDITITPEGDIYKCPATIGNKEFCVGDIENIYLNDKNDKMIKDQKWEECYPCVYLPLCGGGCLYKAFLKQGDALSIDCPRKYLEKSIPEGLKDEYKDHV